jgi:cation transport regulator ChaC
VVNGPLSELSPEQTRAVARKLTEALQAPSYRYPWRGLEEDLVHRQQSALRLLGYGSLVNAPSAARTLTEGTRAPAIAFGARRLFNYEISDRQSRYGPVAHSLARAALNVSVTGRPEDRVNGVIIEVARSDIPALRQRERGYDLRPVACIPWADKNEAPFLAYILECPDEPREGEVHTSEGIEPHHTYYRVCREGAAQIGEDFLRFWLASTYLADGVTPVEHWEATALPEIGDRAGS